MVNRAAVPDAQFADVQQLFTGHRIVECDAAKIGENVREILSDDVAFVAVVGGDGTIRAAAHELRHQPVPLLPVPGGTRNHFARDVGIRRFEDAAAAIGTKPCSVDLGEVNGRTFVNNSSIGLYPRMVRVREAREHRMPKGVANVLAAIEQLRHGRRIHVEVDGVDHTAWMVFVGNGCYGEDLWDLAERPTLDGNVLDIRIVRADHRFARLRVVAAVLFGRLRLSPIVRLSQSRSVVLDIDRASVEVALDGEVERLTPPLEYSSDAGALTVLAGPADE